MPVQGEEKQRFRYSVMRTDLSFNLVLLLMSDYVFVLASSTVCYMVFNFLNLNAGWLHRKDNPHAVRPWRAPTALIAAGAVLAFVNALLLGWGANVWGKGALVTGLVFAALILPVFAYRHYVQDKGRFPESMYQTAADGSVVAPVRRAGVLPYIVLAGGVLMVVIGQLLAAN